ncbi:DUF177 domain-containing protein [uncultured Muribaculum sp.]|uniref:YceD family protein n=1 Tax=uncultured Muribaculum sp. TaxID=1918613 RepID=UPI0025DA9FBA|nr:DUF177 domain-containing protein [uncultured Muribaculum sp.]
MGKFSAYKLPLKTLPHGSHTFDYKLQKQFFVDMESADIRDADIDVHVDVDYKGDLYEITLTVTGEITLICDRCLDDLQWPVDTTFHIFVKYGPDYNDDSDELLEIPESDAELNIAYMMYDTVALTIPIKHVHPLGKCNRAMSSLLKKHRATAHNLEGDGDDEIIDEMIDEVETAQMQPDSSDSDDTPTDPRWDELKKLNDNN